MDAFPPDRSGAPAAAALVAGSDFVRAVLESVSVGIVACDAQGRLQVFNDVARTFHGRSADPSVPPEQWAARYDLYRADGATPLPPEEMPLLVALRDGTVEGVEIVLAPPDGPTRTLRCDGRALTAPDGTVVGAVVAMQDVTVARAAERRLRAAHDALARSTQALARSEAQFRATFDRGPAPMCRLDEDGVVVQLNPALRRLLARSSRDVLGRRLSSLVVPADRQQAEVALAAAGSPHLDVDLVEVRLRRPDGTDVWCEVAVSHAEDADGAPCLLVQLADVDARKRREADLERRATMDELTGLPNRSALLRALSERLAPGPSAAPVPLLLLDLDDFKAVNDSAGHRVGDEVLVEVGRRLVGTVRPGDVVARLGGDEFVVCCAPDATGHERELLARIEDALRPPVPTSVGPRVVGVSIGSSVAQVGEDPGAVLARADAAMYARKRRRSGAQRVRRLGRNPALQPRIAELLATAEEEGRLDVHYQPVVDLRTGAPVGSEALLRLRSRTGGSVGPDAFIPVAEATGDIHALGAYVLREACRQAAAWKAALPAGAPFCIGVNLSPRQLDDPALLGRLDDALATSGLPPSALSLEITERLLTADTEEVRRTLQGVRDRGVHLACDDFGSGYASLRYLDDLPVDILKLDRSWTTRLARGGSSSRLARGVLRLAAATGLVVVAEGIETETERLAVLHENVVVGQGYLFSRPAAADELRLAPALPLPVQRAAEALAER